MRGRRLGITPAPRRQPVAEAEEDDLALVLAMERRRG
jgi:hypothetical protein